MISEGSCDTEDWSNGNFIIGINYILKYIKITVIVSCNNISQYYFFFFLISKKKRKITALVSISYFLIIIKKEKKKYFTDPKLLNATVYVDL